MAMMTAGATAASVDRASRRFSAATGDFGAVQEILEDLRHALTQDRSAAPSAVARLTALLNAQSTGAEVSLYARGGFAPWQERRVKAYIAENLDKPVRLENLARIVSLSASHFSRAFKQTIGRSPHVYLVESRIERAKEMMLTTREPLSQIALACGLADQSHLSKMFRRCVGCSPSVWRRVYAKGT